MLMMYLVRNKQPLYVLPILLHLTRLKTKVYFDAICKNGVYRFTAKIGRYEDGDEFMPDHKWWCELRKDEYHTLTVNYAWLDKEPVALWVE